MLLPDKNAVGLWRAAAPSAPQLHARSREQVADYAAFAASDRAGALTGAIANLSCGSLVD